MRQHNLRVTGSLTVNGENVVSASQLSALNSTLTGQYATTGSNMYNGNQTITGSVIVTGTITANEFHTTFVTSSVLYTSGSTKFGDTNDDIMEVTGSLKVDGNITANNLSGIVSGSSQITSLLPTGVVSGSSQLTASYDVRYVISGSITQTTWDNIASKPAGIVSSSAQVILQSTTGQLSASRVDGLNLTQIGSGSYTASIGQTFNVNTSTIITGSLSVSSLSGSGINYLAYSGGVVTAISGTAAIKYNQEFTATLGQTIFTPSVGYVSGLIDVYYNGTKLSETDYTATNGSTIVLSQGADLAGDIIEVAIYNPVNGVSNNVLRQQTTFTASVAQTTFTINYTPGLIDIFFNGSRLANEEYTANNGTSIILTEATTGGEIIDIFVYSYQVGAFSGVGGSGVLNQLAYWSSQSGLTGSNSLTFDGTTLTISGSLVPAVSGAYDLGSTTKPFRHIYVGSGSIFLVNNQGQVTNTISAQSIVTTDTLNSGSIDLTKSLPTGTVSGSSQIVDILTSLNSFSASNGTTLLNSKTGSYATTGSNTFVGTQIISGSTYVQGDLVVLGSSSIQYISASSVSIGTNIVQLNTATPGIRFAGLAVQDSGSSAGITGSMLWDSLCNRWIYSNPSTICYSGGMLLSGPRASTLGTEVPLTCNYIAKSGGGDHLYDSCIIDDGTTTCIKNNLIGTGTACFAGAVCTPTIQSANVCTDGSYGSRVVAYGSNVGMFVNSTGAGEGYYRILNGACSIGALAATGWYKGSAEQNMGIITGPSKSFQIATNDCANARLTIGADGISVFACQICTPKLIVNNDSDNVIQTQSVYISGTKSGYATYCGLWQNQLHVYDNSALGIGNGGAISFGGNAGGGQCTWYGSIEGYKENATSGDYGGALVFRTRTNGSPTPAIKMRISSTGQVTKPSQPYAAVGITTPHTANGETIIWNYAHTNNGNHYNTSTGLFTVPVAGHYLISIMAMTNGADTTLDIMAIVNGTGTNALVPYSSTSGAIYNQVSGMTILSLAANDTIGVRLNGGSVYGAATGRHSSVTFALLG